MAEMTRDKKKKNVKFDPHNFDQDLYQIPM